MGHLSKYAYLVMLLSACGGGGGSSEPRPVQATIPRIAIQTHHQMMGPVEYDGSLKNTIHGITYSFPGSALSVSAKKFRFNANLNHVDSAIMEIIWTVPTTGHSARFIYFDDGPTNIVQICEITTEAQTLNAPRPRICDITSTFNRLVDGRVDKQIGWQVKDDGLTTATIYEVRLDIVWASM